MHRLLRKYAQFVGLQENYTIYDADDSVRSLRQTLGSLRADAERFTPEAIAKAISWAKNNLIPPDQYKARVGHALGDVVEAVYPAYQNRLATANAADFDDLLFHVATILRDNPEIRAGLDERYRFILVDEYQDTNWRNTSSLGPCRSIIPIWRPPATRTSRSMAGAVRT